MNHAARMESIRSFIKNQEEEVKKNHLELRDKEFMIDGYPHIFSKKVDFKELFRDWGYVPPARMSKQVKHDILKLTRDRHSENTLNWKYWEELRKDYEETKNNHKLFN